ncbi:MAG: 50S ribosomal protein L23 [Lactimicrobium massiliense]|nr:50S ribosomal protein L23 [Lactimicrobium massiliense]MDD6458019.1 50S ribosomal protein L23 [Lactimicrobium massiliense]
MSARDIIVRPIVTEKATKMQANGNWIEFEVARDTNKSAVAQAVQEIYHIKPVAVSIVNTKPKVRRVGRYSGKVRAVKKAMVKLPEGQTIDIYHSED